MSERTIYDITIIGGGPIGLFAAFYAGLRGMRVNIIESLSELGGQPAILYPEKMIYDVPGFPEIKAKELVKHLIKQLERFNESIKITLNEEVINFNKEDDTFIISTNKNKHHSRSIVIACGNGAFAPRPLGLEKEAIYSEKNLYYNIHKIDDFKGKNIVICGGGDSAVDWANMLEPIADSVTVVHRRDAFRAHEHSVEQMKQSSTRLMTPYIPVSLSDKNGYITSLTVQKVKDTTQYDLPLDALIVSYGFSTNNKNLKNWSIDYKRNRIMVSPTFETSLEGVYAIGDVALYQGKLDLIATGFGEAPTAVNQAIQYIYPERDNRIIHSTSLIKNKK